MIDEKMKKKKLKKQDVAPSTFFRRLTAGKNVSSWGGKNRVDALMPRLHQFFNRRF
jgi:hypothetical protein